MTEMRLSIVLSANAGQAKAELAAARAAVDAVEKALGGIGSASAAAARPISQMTGASTTAMTEVRRAAEQMAVATRAGALSFEELRASVDPAYAATRKYTEVQLALAAMVESGEASQRGANIVLEQAASRYMGVATAAERKAQAEREAAFATAMASQNYELLRASVDPVFAASRRYEAALETLNAAQAAGVISDKDRVRTLSLIEAQMIQTAQAATRMGAANAGAAANTANLGYQLNDVVMMASLGQSPFALMMQQGPQIIQVLNTMKATGQAIGPAIGRSLMAFVNPMGLATLAAVAGAAALAQWAISAMAAGEEAKSFEDRVDDLDAALSAIDRHDFSNVFAGMEAQAERIRNSFTETLALIEKADRQQLQTALQDTISAIGLEDALVSAATRRSVSAQLNLEQPAFSALGFNDYEQAIAAAEVLRTITGDTREEVAASFEAALRWLEACGLLTPELEAQLAILSDRIGLDQVLRDAIEAQREETERLNDQEVIRNRNIFERQSLIADERGSQRAIRSELEAIRELQADDLAAARAKMAELSAETVIHAAILQFGEDSQQVEEARAAAARGVYAAWVDGLSVAQSVKDELMLSYDIEVMMGQAAIDAPISAAASEAARLAGNLQAAAAALASIGSAVISAAVSNAGARAQLTALEAGQSIADASVAARLAEEQTRLAPALGSSDMGMRMGAQQQLDALEAQLREGVALAGEISVLETALRSTDAGGGGGGGSGRDRDAVDDYIKGLQEELALLRETDPVQQEMIRNRDMLADATAAQREQIQQLIPQIEAERAAAEASAEAWDFLGETGKDALMSIATGSESVAEAAKKAAGALAEAVIQAALLGEGPFGGLFGGTSIFELAFGAITGGKAAGVSPGLKMAEGGLIEGPGTGTSDEVLLWGSNGEFVVNAAATARHRTLLEAMNSGASLPRYARGGLIGSAMSGEASGSRSGDTLNVNIDLRGARGNAEIEEAAMRGMQAALDDYDLRRLPESWMRINLDRTRRN